MIEKKFLLIEYLSEYIKNFQSLELVFEHISTKDAVEFVIGQINKVAATITPQHMLLDRNDLLVGGLSLILLLTYTKRKRITCSL